MAPAELHTVKRIFGLIHSLNVWHLVAYCHLRHDIRNFRLDRVERLELLLQTFQRPNDFKMQENRRVEQNNIVVRARFDKEVARWVRESRYYYTVAEEEDAAGLLVTLQVRQENEILQWLSWGQHVQVLEPTLRQTISEEAKEMRWSPPITLRLITQIGSLLSFFPPCFFCSSSAWKLLRFSLLPGFPGSHHVRLYDSDDRSS